MSKQEYLKWLEEMEAKGMDDAEIDAAVEDYLDQPESPEWHFIED